MTPSDSPSQPTPMIHGRLFLHSPDGKALGGVPISLEKESDAHTVTNELGEFSLPTTGLRPGYWARFKLDLEGADLVPLHPYMLNVLVPDPHASTEPVILLLAAPDDRDQYAAAWFIPRANAALEARLRRDFPDDPTLFEVSTDGRNRTGKGTEALWTFDTFVHCYLHTDEPEWPRCRTANYLAFAGEFDLALAMLDGSTLLTVADLPPGTSEDDRKQRANEWRTRMTILSYLVRTDEAFECEVHARVLDSSCSLPWTWCGSETQVDLESGESLPRFIDQARRGWGNAELALLLVWQDQQQHGNGERPALLEALDLLRTLAAKEPDIWLKVLIHVLVDVPTWHIKGALGDLAPRLLDEAEALLRPVFDAAPETWRELYTSYLQQRVWHLEAVDRLDEARAVLLALLTQSRISNEPLYALLQLVALEQRAGNSAVAEAYALEAFQTLADRATVTWSPMIDEEYTRRYARSCADAGRGGDGVAAFDLMIARNQAALAHVPTPDPDDWQAGEVIRDCVESTVRLILAKSRFQLGLRDVEAAIVTCEEGLAMGRDYVANFPWLRTTIAGKLSLMDSLLRRNERPDLALHYEQMGIALHREHLAFWQAYATETGNDNTVAGEGRHLAKALHEYAKQRLHDGQLHEARAAIDEAVPLLRHALGRADGLEPFDMAQLLDTQATVLIAAGDPEAAAASLREAMVHIGNDQYRTPEFLQSRREELQARLDELGID